jgi:hypothetical protein
MRRYKKRKQVGRTKEKLSDLLYSMGFDVPAESLHRIYGTDKMDLARWGGYGELLEKGQYGYTVKVYTYSWSTMTDCVRYGMSYSRDTDGFHYEFSSNKP